MAQERPSSDILQNRFICLLNNLYDAVHAFQQLIYIIWVLFVSNLMLIIKKKTNWWLHTSFKDWFDTEESLGKGPLQVSLRIFILHVDPTLSSYI